MSVEPLSGERSAERALAARRLGVFGTHNSPIRGRTDELDLVDQLIADLSGGLNSVLLVEGPPGIGKTRLLAEVRRRSTAAGARPLTAKAFEDQQTVPFALLISAFADASPPVGDWEALQELDLSPDRRYWVVRDLESAIAEAAADAPLAVVLDDVQWADTGSVVVLRALMDGLVDVPVSWTLAMRSGVDRPANRDALEAMVLARGQRGRRLRLSAVSVDAAADIAQDVLAADIDDSLRALTSTARGNPFLLHELLDGLREENRVSIEAGLASATGRDIPRRLAGTMNQRLDRLSPRTRELVQMASVLPEEFTANLLARMVGQHPSNLVDLVGEAMRADLFTEIGDRLRFRHELLRDAVRHAIPQTLRRALDREAAGVLLAAGAAPEEVAHQIARSADRGDREAVATLRRAADSVSRTDPSAAADLSRRALELMRTDDGHRPAVVAETVWLLNQAQRFDEALSLFTAALSSDLPAEAEAQIRLSMSMISARGPGQRADENRRSLRLARVSAEVRAAHTSWLAYNIMMDGQTSQVRSAAQQAIEASVTTADTKALVLARLAMANIDCAEGYRRRSRDSLEELRQRSAVDNLGVVEKLVTFHRANVALTLGLVGEASEAIATGLAAARRGEDITVVHNFMQLDALRAVSQGDLTEAQAISESFPGGIDFIDEGASGLIHTLVLSQLAARTGERRLLVASAAAARHLLERGPARRRAGLAALAHLAWQRGDVEQTRQLLTEDVDLLGTPMFAVDLDYVILAARIAGDHGDAGLRARVSAALTLLEREPDGIGMSEAVAAHVRGLLHADPVNLAFAVDAFAESERPLLHASATEDHGRALAADQRAEAAVDQLNRAFDAYVACRSTTDARRVGRILATLGVERRIGRPRIRTGWESLTATERKVVDMVAAGATNREVADNLWLSPHTVNTHLRNAYHKLQIRSREELRRLAADSRAGGQESP